MGTDYTEQYYKELALHKEYKAEMDAILKKIDELTVFKKFQGWQRSMFCLTCKTQTIQFQKNRGMGRANLSYICLRCGNVKRSNGFLNHQ